MVKIELGAYSLLSEALSGWAFMARVFYTYLLKMIVSTLRG
jgi:hypothetical protein